LEAQGFSGTCGHDSKGVFSGQNTVDKNFLPLPETVVAEIVL